MVARRNTWTHKSNIKYLDGGPKILQFWSTNARLWQSTKRSFTMCQTLGMPGRGRTSPRVRCRSFFIFIFFIFVFYKNIFLFSKFTGIYPDRLVFCKSFCEEFALKPLEDRSPDNGTTGPPGRPAAGRQAPAARQRDDRLPRPYIRGWLPPPPHLPH